MTLMNSIYEVNELIYATEDWKKNNETIALVPTMGSLHAGHIYLIKEAKKLASKTVVSIFVNPIQFGRGEDYESYPSSIDADKKMLETEGVDLIFLPNLSELYPLGTDVDTRVTVPQISEILCGKHRPGHFSGVATVVTKLLVSCSPNFALFGKKDYQQLLVIKRMVSDLLIPTTILGMPTQRDADGLALSSRNRYLSERERTFAPKIYSSLLRASDVLKKKGPQYFYKVKKEIIAELESKEMKVEYFEMRKAQDLSVPEKNDKGLVILIAVWLGKARLIDNIGVEL